MASLLLTPYITIFQVRGLIHRVIPIKGPLKTIKSKVSGFILWEMVKNGPGNGGMASNFKKLIVRGTGKPINS